MCEYVTAEEGSEWALAEKGKEISRIAVKYESSGCGRNLYKNKVPKKWVEEGYVKQVKR